METRADVMARMYGEVCTKAQAARMLNCSPRTIGSMLADGRLDTACGGEKVDVRSIARYIESPAQADSEARKAKLCAKYGVQPRFAV